MGRTPPGRALAAAGRLTGQGAVEQGLEPAPAPLAGQVWGHDQHGRRPVFVP